MIQPAKSKRPGIALLFVANDPLTLRLKWPMILAGQTGFPENSSAVTNGAVLCQTWHGRLRRLRHQRGFRRHSFKFNFFSDSRNRVAYLFDYPLKITRGKSQSPFPGSNLTRIRQINFIANWRMFGATHVRSPGASASSKEKRLGEFPRR